MGWLLSLEAFLSLSGGNLRGGLKRGSQQSIHQFPRCVLSGSGSPLMGQRQSRGSLVIVVAPGVAHLVWCFSRPGAETPLRPRCHLWGERPGQERSPWGWGPCVPRISPWQALGTLFPGDPLHRAVNCWATVFSPLSQFPYSTCLGTSLASHYPVSIHFVIKVILDLIRIHILSVFFQFYDA